MLLIAIVPAIALMIFIYFQDNHEKEPISLLLKIFGLGILSAIPAMILERIADPIISVTFGGTNLIFHAVTALFGVAIIEEGVKFGAAYFLTWRNKTFNYKFDGIVYCLFGSMGFAAIENVMYIFMSGEEAALSTGISRGLLAIPCHGMCAIFMGYYYGNAKYLKSYGDRAGCKRNMITGFTIASLLHAFYDFCLFTQNGFFMILFFMFVVIADIFTVIRIFKARKENQKMYEAPQYRQYWVGPATNPYQPYGGYAAPSYGGYKTEPQVVGQNTYNPQVAQQNSSIYQQAAQEQFAQPQVMQQQYAQPQAMQQQYAQPQVMQQYAETQPSYTPLQFNEDAQNLQRQEFQQPQYETGAYGQTAQPAAMITPNIRERMIKCPVCGTVVSFNAFYCKSCGASIHQL